MKKSEQILAYNILLLSVALSMFITALIKQIHILSIFGFALLIGSWIIRILAKKETIIVLKEVNPTWLGENIFVVYWNKFITWLNT